MSRKILITGGSGFLGSALVRRMIKDGHAVRVLDDNSRGAPRRLAGLEQEIEFRVGDIRDTQAVIDASRGVDTIVHMAAVNGTEFFYQRPELVLDVAVRGMLAVIDACRKNSIGDLVVASSSEAYQTPVVIPTPEDVPLVVPDVLNPRYSYGGGKILSELVAINYGRTGFDRACIFRPHNVYGKDMGWEHVIPQFSLRAADMIDQQPSGRLDFKIQGDGSQTRAFIHVDDFTDGLAKVVERGEHLGIYHIGNPEEVSISELARLTVACLGREATIQSGASPEGQTNRRCPDITRLRQLGFAPRIQLSEGLSEVVNWYQSNRHLRP